MMIGRSIMATNWRVDTSEHEYAFHIYKGNSL